MTQEHLEPIPQPDDTNQHTPASAAAEMPTALLEIEAVYRDGLLHPASPLDVPPGSSLRLRIVPQPHAADSEGNGRASAADLAADAEQNNLPAAEEPHISPAAADADSTRPQPRLLLALGLALALAGLGQYILASQQEASLAGVALYALALVFFVLTVAYRNHSLLRSPERQPAAETAPAPAAPVAPDSWLEPLFWARNSVLQYPRRVLALGGALALMGLHLYLLAREPALESYNWTIILWLGAIGLYLVAVHPFSPRRLLAVDWQSWRAALRARWPLVAALGTIMLLALLLRVWNLGGIPPTLGGDEGSQGLEAMRVLEGDISNPFTTGWLGVPTMSFYFNALTIGPMGNSMLALRLPWVIIGTLTVLVVFFLTWRLMGLTLALTTAALLATYHYHIHFSRLGSNQVADALFVALALLFLYRGYDERRPLDWALCGVIIGVGQFFYAGARFTAVVVITTVIFFAIRDGLPFIRMRYRELLALAGAALITSAPMIQYAIRFPNDYNARVNEVGIIQSGWLEREQLIRGEGPLPILFDQLQRAALSFNFYADRNVWYGSDEPLMHSVMAALFLLGFGYGVLHLGNRRIYPMVAWWGGAMLLGGMLTESPPSSQRLITMAAPGIFFVALALVKIGQIVLQALQVQRTGRFLLPYLTAGVLGLSALSLNWYFLEFTPMYRYGSYNGVVATSIGNYAREHLDESWHMYFAGPPRMYIGFGSIPYLAPDVQGEDFVMPLEAPFTPEKVRRDKNLAFIFLPERRAELALVQQAFPQGEVQEIPSPIPDDTKPLYILYRVPQSQIPE